MGRSATGTNVPTNREFAAKSENDADGRAADDAAWSAAKLAIGRGDVLEATRTEKVEYYYAKAQKMANDNNCAMLCAFVNIPHFQNTPETLTAFLVPSIEPATEPA